MIQWVMKRDGRKLDHQTLETIRIMAVERVREGEAPSAVVVVQISEMDRRGAPHFTHGLRGEDGVPDLSCSMRLLSGMCRPDTPIHVSWSRRIDYRRATGIGVSGARMAGRPKISVS